MSTLPMTAPATGHPLVTLVIPARNEEGNIARLEKEVLDVVAALPQYRFEFIVIDNHSSDSTGELVKAICARDARWKYLRFSRNFTVEMSITAGYHFATGDAIIVLYSDLQDPPDVIPHFLKKWEEGWDVVYGVRTIRPGDPQWRNFMVKIAYRLIAASAEMPIPTDAGDFRLIDRKVRDALEQVQEQNRYMRGLIAWLGFRQTSIEYERRPRKAGRSSAPFWNTVFFTFNAITAFSMKPLRLFTFLGFILLALSALGILIYSVLFLTGQPPAGITTLIVLSLLALGINSLGIGILGEYIGRTYTEVKFRPLYIVQEQVGLPAPEPRTARTETAKVSEIVEGVQPHAD
jgi:glycosyltransferase involved in cell wall biosynthesis